MTAPSKPVFLAVPGSRLSNRDAERAGRVIQDIQGHAGGACAPKALVDAAKSPKSPIHHLFEWNDGVAAERYRLEQARWVIRSVRIEYQSADQKTVSVRPFIAVSEPGESQKVYVGIDRAMQDETYRLEVVEQALADLHSFYRRYTQFKELSELKPVLVTIGKLLRSEEARAARARAKVKKLKKAG